MLLLLLSLTGSARALSANLAQMTAYSYQMCATDALCARRWFIDDAPLSLLAQETFAYLFANWAADVDANYVVSLDTCSRLPDSETTPCHELNFAWLVGLRSAVHCGAPNQRFVYGRGCVCPAGSNCKLSQNDSFFVGLPGLSLAVGVFGVIAAVYMVMLRYRVRAIEMSVHSLHSAQSLPVKSE